MAGARAPLVALLLWALGPAEEAWAVAPNLDWRTVLTPHFRVHYHRGEAQLADRMAHLGEEVLPVLAKALGHFPEDPIHIILTDETDSANGLADVLPYNHVLLFAAVPDVGSGLGDFDEYRRMLLTHELAHIVHLDDISGLPALANRIIGKQLSPNLVAPRWLIEGLAVWLETTLTSRGRGTSSLTDMVIRAQIYDGVLPSIDEFTTSRRAYPGATAPYLYGGRFMSFIARRHGPDAIGEMTHHYGGRVVPYGLNIVARDATGEDFVSMYEAWVEEERALAQAVLERVVDPTPFRLLPGLPAIVHGLRFSPSGRAALVLVPRDDDPELVFYEAPTGADGSLGPELGRLRTSEGLGAFTPDGQRFVAVVSDVVEHRFRFRDLEVIDLSTWTRRRRTEGARLSDPDVGLRGGGLEIAAVAQEGGHTRIVRLSVDGDDRPRTEVDRGPAAQLFSPRYAKDGRALVYGVAEASGIRRLIWRDLADGTERELCSSQSLLHDPRFSADGRSLLFTDDRDGIFDVYAVDLEGREVTRRTRVTTGVFEPIESPDGARLFARVATSGGFALGEVKSAHAPAHPPPAPAILKTQTASATLSVFPEEPYTPWETLLPKAYILGLSLTRSSVQLSLSLSGSDAIERHGYRFDLFYSGEAQRLGFDLVYTNHQLWTPLTISARLDATPYLATYRPFDRNGDVLTSRFILRGGLDVPLGDWRVGHGFSFSYDIELRTAVDGPPPDPFQRAPRLSPELRLAGVGASWRISTVRNYEDSISLARGFAFDVGLHAQHPALGSELRVLELSAHFAAFLPSPWLRSHIFALRLSGGTSLGAPGDRAAYALGGLPVRNLFQDLISGGGFGADVIRGFLPGARRGSSFYVGTLEYRMLLFRVERGLDTVPVFFDRVSLAAFVDAGDAPRDTPQLADLAVGVGGELRAEIAVLYYVPITFRGGYGRGFGAGGTDDVYLVLGGSF